MGMFPRVIARACSLVVRHNQNSLFLIGKACLNASDTQSRGLGSIGKSLEEVSAVTSIRDAGHCFCLRTAVKMKTMLGGRNGRGPSLLKRSGGTPVLNASACD